MRGCARLISRRRAIAKFMGGAATLVAVPKVSRSADEGSVPKSSLGLVTYCCRIRRDHLKRGNPPVDLGDPVQFLDHCRSLGAGGIQASLGTDSDAARMLRARAEQYGMFVEGIVRLPKDNSELDHFDAALNTAVAAGAKAVRTTIIPGRRYEYFDSMDKFREYDARGRRMLELAAPRAEKHRIAIAVENHKDHRDEERVRLFERISSEFVGACVDTGNSIALLEDPVGTAKALAPWAHSVHLKDQAVQLYDDGFLLGDIPLGQGFIDLKPIVDILREAKPGIHFSLELITRDPLKVPVPTDNYWATFPDIRGRGLARMLRAVRDGATDNLQYISTMSAAEQLRREDANVRESLQYARDQLGLSDGLASP